MSEAQKRRCKCCRGFITIIVPRLYTVFCMNAILQVTSGHLKTGKSFKDNIWDSKSVDVHTPAISWAELILNTLYKIHWSYLLKCVLWD